MADDIRSADVDVDLARAFDVPQDRSERVGIEVECGLVDPATGISVPYEGRGSGRALLSAICSEFDKATPLTDGPNLVGVRMPSGGELSLEMGGALEYSSEVYPNLGQAVRAAQEEIAVASRLAHSLGVAVIAGGILPFTPMASIPWIPKPRVQIMRNYFARLGDDGAFADGVMGLTLSTQVTLDYVSHADLFEKLRMQVLASPILAALFVNSPIAGGTDTGALSRRMQFWRKIDPARCGVQSWALHKGASVDDLIEQFLDLPMIYRDVPHGSSCGGHAPGPLSSFRELVRNGFPEGTRVTERDWRSLLCQVWPQVRVRNTIELRALDGTAWPAMPASPAVWVGLTYDRDARRAALDLLAGLTATDLDRAHLEIAATGLAASIGPYPVHELARELLGIARRGLAARVRDGIEPSEVLSYLDPIDEVLHTGDTFAERLLRSWHGELDKKPERYVRQHRVSPRT